MVLRGALFLTLGLLGSASATFDCATSKTGCTALDDYVAAEDDAYNWVDLNITIEGPGWTAHVLNLTSQKWLTSNDWDYTVDSEGKRAGAAPVRKDLGYVDVVEKSEGCRNRGMK